MPPVALPALLAFLLSKSNNTLVYAQDTPPAIFSATEIVSKYLAYVQVVGFIDQSPSLTVLICAVIPSVVWSTP